MKKLLIVCLCMLMVCQSVYAADITATDVIATPTDVATTTTEKVYCNATLEDNFVDDCVVIVLNKEYTHKRIDFTPSHFPGVKISSIRSIMSLSKPSNPCPEEADRKNAENENFREIIEIKLQEKGKQNVLDAIKELEKIPFVVSAEPNKYINSNISTESSERDSAELLTNRTIDFPTDDPEYIRQYGLRLADFPKAWDISVGSSAIKVGVIDTGISNHVDLAANLEYGKDCITGATNFMSDYAGHGTKVAGIIGAATNNGRGISGTNWYIKLVPLRVKLDTFDQEFETSYTDALVYATNNNIDILNISSGVYTTSYHLTTAFQSYDGLIICAAGNGHPVYGTPLNTDTTPHYPSAFPFNNIISVAATGMSDELWVDSQTGQGSNYGATSVDLAAPGIDIYTTFTDNTYGKVSGTSFAAPHVTGAAALIKSCYPSMTVTQIKSCILNGVDKVEGLTGKVLTGGRLNAYKSLMLAQEMQTYTVVSGCFNYMSYAEPACFKKVGTNKTQLIVWDTLSNANFFNNNIMWESSSFNCDKIQDKVVAGNFNGDDYEDIAVMYDYGSNSSSIMVWNGSRVGISFSNTAWSGNSFNASSVNAKMVAGDFNGDGYDDVAAFYDCGNSQTNLYLWRGSNTGLAYHGMIWTAPSFNAGCILGTVTAGDLNGDGKDDIAAFYDYGADSRLFVWKGTASGVSLLPGSACWYSSAFDSGNTRYKISCGDYNFDGKDDISVFFDCGNTTTKLFVWHGSSTSDSCVEIDDNHGTWVSTTFVASYINRKVTSLDFDRDNLCDIWYIYYGEHQSLRSTGTSFVWAKHVN